jgi:SAM-dependent methyltransferase
VTLVSIVDRLDATHPGLKDYVAEVAAYLRLPRDHLLQGFARGLDKLGEPAARQACRDWENLGILPGVVVRDDAQVAGVWRSPLFRALLDDGLRFYPPPGTDVRAHVPPPRRTVEELLARPFPSLVELSYWQQALARNLPELYLDPFLPRGRDLAGCDLACGWGRATLSLRGYEGHHIHCCDLSNDSLDRLQALAERAGVGGHITTHACDVTRLPFAALTFDYFLAFDIFEHLSDDALHRLVAEILRVARPGAVLYAEIPLHAHCPAVTHIQDFSLPRVLELFHSCRAGGRGYRLARHDPRLRDHFTFLID